MLKLTYFIAISAVMAACLLCIGRGAVAAELNPKTHYLDKGEVVDGWSFALGDMSNWYQPVLAEEQVSGKKAIAFSEIKATEKPAIHLQWLSKKKSASFALSGAPVDLSAYRDSIGLAIDMKIDRRLRSSLKLSMDCTYPCRGSVDLKPLLDALPKNEWITLPIPLRCFEQAGADLSKINAPFHLQAKGKFELSIAGLKLVQLPADYPLCRE